MTKEEILEGKRVCCEFMGVKPQYNSYTGKFSWGDGCLFMSDDILFEKVMDAVVEYAKYDSDWNWLMGVVKKLMDIFQTCDDYESSPFYSEEWESIEAALPFANIDTAFQAVVEFIQFYNDNSSK